MSLLAGVGVRHDEVVGALSVLEANDVYIYIYYYLALLKKCSPVLGINRLESESDLGLSTVVHLLLLY